MRYFIIFYTGHTTCGKPLNGNSSFTNESYPNSKSIVEKIKDSSKKSDGYDVIITVTNITEVSEDDHNSWIGIQDSKVYESTLNGRRVELGFGPIEQK
jgi:hypothetical protein